MTQDPNLRGISTTWEFGLTSKPLGFILNGKKTIEGRLNTGKFAQFEPGDTIRVRADLFDEYGNTVNGIADATRLEVVAVRQYPNFLELLAAEGYEKVIPYAASIEEANENYAKFYTSEEQQKYGVLAIEIKVAKIF